MGTGEGEAVVSGGIVSFDSGGGVTSSPGLTGCEGKSVPTEMTTTTTTTIAIAPRTAKIDFRLL